MPDQKVKEGKTHLSVLSGFPGVRPEPVLVKQQ
jgi:hypothetical protein